MSQAEKYRKRPVVIEAMRLTEDTMDAVADWCHGTAEVVVATGPGRGVHKAIAIRTLEGTMRGDSGDWVIRGVQGEHYPCKPDIFEATYEPAD